MTGASKGAILIAVVLSIGIAAGMGIGWKLWKPKTAVVETYAREQRQTDGSLVLERKPQPDAKPAQEIPKGAKVERIVQVTVDPTQPSAALAPMPGIVPVAGANLQTTPPSINPTPCPPVRLDLTLIRLPDLTRRVIASSPDGRVTGGVDIPVDNPPAPRELKWAVGAVYGGTAWGDKAVGAFLDRDFAFLRTGAELTKNTYALQARQGWEIRARLGIRF